MQIDRSTRVVQTRISPYYQGDRVKFDFTLPADCTQVLGILTDAVIDPAVVSVVGGNPWAPCCAGNLSLRWAGPGDIFFQSRVEWAKSYGTDYTPMWVRHPAGLWQRPGEMAINGTQILPMEMKVPGNVSRLEGYYKDSINQLTGIDSAYSVTINLYYTTSP